MSTESTPPVSHRFSIARCPDPNAVPHWTGDTNINFPIIEKYVPVWAKDLEISTRCHELRLAHKSHHVVFMLRGKTWFSTESLFLWWFLCFWEKNVVRGCVVGVQCETNWNPVGESETVCLCADWQFVLSSSVCLSNLKPFLLSFLFFSFSILLIWSFLLSSSGFFYQDFCHLFFPIFVNFFESNISKF